jgi:hypothetical protein
MTSSKWGVWLLTALVLAACSKAQDVPRNATMDEHLASDLDLIARARVYFGHQSVGDNIIAGVRDLAENRIAIAPVADLDRQPLDQDALFLHAPIGTNGEPATKLAAFERTVDDLNVGHRHLDVAFMKFCYLDFSAGTDVAALFADYEARLSGLEARHPHTRFLHVTTPLKADEGVKGLIKTWIGRGRPTDDNIQRNRYNALLRERFGPESVFDLAAIESTRPDGSRSLFEQEGAAYEQLAADYSSDGGHLNPSGQLAAGRALVASLAAAIRSSAPAYAGLTGGGDVTSSRSAERQAAVPASP